MDRYNFKSIEEKWQKIWEENKTFSTKIDTSKKILLSRNVPLPLGKNTHGPCKELYNRRRFSKI